MKVCHDWCLVHCFIVWFRWEGVRLPALVLCLPLVRSILSSASQFLFHLNNYHGAFFFSLSLLQPNSLCSIPAWRSISAFFFFRSAKWPNIFDWALLVETRWYSLHFPTMPFKSLFTVRSVPRLLNFLCSAPYHKLLTPTSPLSAGFWKRWASGRGAV